MRSRTADRTHRSVRTRRPAGLALALLATTVALSPGLAWAESGGWPWTRVAREPTPDVMREAELTLAALVEAARVAPQPSPGEPIHAEMFTQAPSFVLSHEDRVERLRNVQPGDPAYPDAVLGATGDYVMRREYYESQIRALDQEILRFEAEGKHELVARLRKKQVKFAAQAREASLQAARLLRTLTTTPGFEQMKDFDEVLYRAARESAYLGDELRMRESAGRLQREYPASPQVVRMQLVLADYTFDHGDIAAALGQYDQVLTTAKGPVRAYALYRRARCDLQARDGATPKFAAAVAGLTTTIEATIAAATTHPRYIEPLQALASAARQELVQAFAATEPPKRAWALFRRLGVGPKEKGDIPQRMLRQLASVYFKAAAYAASTEVYEQLQELYPDARRHCVWQAAIVVNALARPDRATQLREALLLAWEWRTLRDDPTKHTSDERMHACSEPTHATLRSLALALHRESRASTSP